MASSPPSPSRLRSAGRVLAVVVVAVTLFFALGEIAARTFHLVDRLNGFPRHLYETSDDEELPYVLRPSLDTTARDVHVVVDEHRMRVADATAKPKPGARRILVLGDSVVFGFHLPFEETLGAKLERELERRTGQPYRVLNGGVEGYNTVNQLAWLRRYGFAQAPDAVVLVFNLNDYDYGPVMGANGVLTTNRSERVSTWSLANLSDFYVLLRWLYKLATRPPAANDATGPAGDDGESGTGGQKFLLFDRFVSNLRKQYYREPNDERWPQMIAALRALRDETARRGIPLLVAVLPDGDQIGVSDPDLLPQRRLAEICAEEGLDCLDLRPVFAAHAGEGDLFLDIMHPNAAGHTIVARALADRLDEENP